MGKGSRQQNQNHGGKSKNQRREESERKRDERAQRHALRREKQAQAQFGIDDGEFKSFRNQLQKQGLKMRDVLGDGNCLFRALSDQMDGNETMHKKHRTDVVKYMTEHEDEFAPFLEETVTYKNYLKDLSSQGTYGGNDSIVAFARANNVDVVIHQLNSPTFIVEGNTLVGQKVVVHLAYHDFEHYSSVRRTSDPCNGPAFMHHQESDSVASRKVVETDTANNATTTSDATATSRKSKRKEKKQAQASTVEISKVDEENEAFISEAVEEIKTKSGLEDTKYVRDIFEENSYDIDASLTYLLQTMHLGVDNNVPGCSKSCDLQDVEQKQPQKDEKINQDENGDFISEAVEEIKMRSGLDDTKYVRGIFEDNSYDIDASLTYIFQTMHLGYNGKDKDDDAGCSKEPEEEPLDGTTVDTATKEQGVSRESSENEDEYSDEDDDDNDDNNDDNDEKGRCCCACDDTTSTNCNCNGSEERRGRRNIPTKKSAIQTRQTQGGKKHLSNRQRKEMAKQDRKKRRQETRRADNSKEKKEEDKPSEPIQSINI